MKKYLVLVLLIITFNLHSQIEKPINKGDILLGGGFSVRHTSSTTNNNKSTSMAIHTSPKVGLFVTDGLCIGAYLPISFSNAKYNEYTSWNGFSMGIGPFVRYYFDFGLLLKLDSSMLFSSQISDNDSFENVGKHYLLKPGIGYAFFINSKVSIEPVLNYSFQKNAVDYSSNTDTNVSIDKGLYLSVGFQVFL